MEHVARGDLAELSTESSDQIRSDIICFASHYDPADVSMVEQGSPRRHPNNVYIGHVSETEISLVHVFLFLVLTEPMAEHLRSGII